jgi:N-acetylglutamate synthase-like GNAT family acetyltransferase
MKSFLSSLLLPIPILLLLFFFSLSEMAEER